MALPHLAIKKHFRKLRDPRVTGRSTHLLLDIITITLCCTIANCNDWQEIETFAKARIDWFKKFLRLPGGIPSHDTLERVFDQLDPHAFQAGFRSWMLALHQALGLSTIAIDGKTLRGSGVDGQKPLHLVSAWATANHLSLGQVTIDEKSNEIPAIPKLLELLDIQGALVTIDAMGCQKEIAAKIIERQGDYVLTVKDNQPTLKAEIEACFEKAALTDFKTVEQSAYKTEERGHGREELRHYHVLLHPEFATKAEWAGLKVIGKCFRRTIRDGKPTEEVCYFIGSRKTSAKVYGNALRGHWGIENTLHWSLDVTFAEDANRVSRRHGAENLAACRRVALSLLKQQPDKKSIACKRVRAAADPAYLEEVLRGDGNLDKI